MHTNLFDLTAILSGISLFEGLAPAALVELARSAHIANLPKGRTVYSAGDPSRALYYLLSGQLKVAVSSPEGGEKVFDIVSPRQTFGVAELFGQTSHVSFAEAVTPAVVLIVGREGVFRAIEQDARLSLRMLNVVANRQASIERDIAADCFQSGMGKVWSTCCGKRGPGRIPATACSLNWRFPNIFWPPAWALRRKPCHASSASCRMPASSACVASR